MFNWMTEWIHRVVDAYAVACNDEGYNLNDPATLARSRQDLKAEIHQMRLDATLASLCGNPTNEGGHLTQLNDRYEAAFLFAQADRLEHELRYGSLRLS